MISNPLKAPRLAMFTSVVLAAAGCNGAPAPSAPVSGAAPPTAPAPAPANPSIVGTVLLSTTHKPAPLGGVVYIDDAPRQPGKLMAADIAIHHKEFTPFIAVLTAGGRATFENTDPVPHHVFSPDVKGWDTGFLKKGEPVARTFDTPGPVALLCNIHPEMLGYLLVIPSTYFGKIGPDGKYVIEGVPPGTYKATAWVPRAPTVTEPVTVSAGGEVTEDFEVQPADGKP